MQLQPEAICAALDSCLATDTEMDLYCVRHAEAINEENKARKPLRFALGDPVLCYLGDEWARGMVVTQYYREPEWEVERWSAYQVRLKGPGRAVRMIWAPDDIESCIKAAWTVM